MIIGVGRVVTNLPKWLSRFCTRMLLIGKLQWSLCWCDRMWGRGVGMWGSFGILMIVNWRWLWIFFIFWSLIVGGDWVQWRLKKNWDFDIYSYYNALRGSSSVIFPCKGIWGMKAFPRVSFFVWMVAWGKILTGENLRRRGFTIMDWCCMCHSSGEIVDHLLINCGGAISCGALFLDCLGSLLGPTRESPWPFIWVEVLVGEAFIGYLEFGSVMFDVNFLAGA